MVSPGERARADQIRAGLSETLREVCTCGDCPTDEQVRAALALDDAELVALVDE